ncbi:MAG: hypothetical protein QM713_01880 [Arachnia sp.]
MSFPRILAAEISKAISLPATYVAGGISLAASVALAAYNANGVRADIAAGHLENLGYTSSVEAAFSATPLGTVGAVILGVVAMSSEYAVNSPDAGGSRQISATLTAAPRRVAVFAAKAVTVVLLVALLAALSLPTSLALTRAIIGTTPAESLQDLAVRSGGVSLYWVLTALLALGIAALARSGVVPLVILIANSSLVSFSILLSQLTPLAYYLPDLAGMRLFADETWAMVDDALDPVVGALVMGAWVSALLAAGAVAFVRRDA